MGAALAKQKVHQSPDQLTQEFLCRLWLALPHPTDSQITAAAMSGKEVARPYNRAHCPRPYKGRDYSARIVRKGTKQERQEHPTVIIYTYQDPEVDASGEAQPLKLIVEAHEYVYMRFRPGHKVWVFIYSLESVREFSILLQGDFSPLEGKEPDNIFLYSND